MSFDDQMLQRLEKLSMLTIEEGKRQAMIEELQKIVSFVEILSELDTQGRDPSFHPLDASTPLREDRVDETASIHEIILQNAPKSTEDYFVVPTIIA